MFCTRELCAHWTVKFVYLRANASFTVFPDEHKICRQAESLILFFGFTSLCTPAIKFITLYRDRLECTPIYHANQKCQYAPIASNRYPRKVE